MRGCSLEMPLPIHIFEKEKRNGIDYKQPVAEEVAHLREVSSRSVDEMRATIRTDVVGIESVSVKAGTAGVIAALTRAIAEMLRVLHWQIVTVGVMPLMHRHRR
jgi:hypothetical protein